MKTKFITSYLLVYGFILFGIGAVILLAPEAFHASNGYFS